MTQTVVKIAEAGIGDNSIVEKIQGFAVEYSECDEKSQELNDKRKSIRDRVKGLDLDPKAWQDAISRAKNTLKKRDGYDESLAVINNAIGQMDMAELWGHVERRKEAQQKAREDKKAEKQKKVEAKAEKAKSSQKSNDV